MLFPQTAVGYSGFPMYPRLLMSLTASCDWALYPRTRTRSCPGLRVALTAAAPQLRVRLLEERHASVLLLGGGHLPPSTSMEVPVAGVTGTVRDLAQCSGRSMECAPQWQQRCAASTSLAGCDLVLENLKLYGYVRMY